MNAGPLRSLFVLALVASGLTAQCPVQSAAVDGRMQPAPAHTVLWGEVHATTHPITREPVMWSVHRGDQPVCRFPAEGVDPVTAALLATYASAGKTFFVATDGLGNLQVCIPDELLLQLWLTVGSVWWMPERSTLAACLSVLLFGGCGVWEPMR